MKNKVIVFVLIGLGVIAAVIIGIYLAKQNKSDIDPAENIAQENQSNTPIGNNGYAKVEPPQNKLVTDDFSLDLPTGWKKIQASIGASAMAINANENINDPAVQKINFKSYLAVSYDVFQGKTISEYAQTVKTGLEQAIPGVVFTKEQEITMNGKSASAIEAEMTQQGVDFKVLVIAVKGEGEDVWVISFNTVKSSWLKYKDTFYSTAESFSLKK